MAAGMGAGSVRLAVVGGPHRGPELSPWVRKMGLPSAENEALGRSAKA